MNKYTYIVLAVVLVGVGFFVLKGNKQSIVSTGSPLNATYNIAGSNVTLVNGVAEQEVAPGSASKLITQYFGNEVKHDFDGDGREDSAFLLTQSLGGSGTFYYVVAALNTKDGYVGSQAVLLGDRISPQTTVMATNTVNKNIIVVNYADRAVGESFTTPPSVGKSIWLLLDPKTMQFGEVVQNFEGEADPSSMTLFMKKWDWISTTYNDGTVISPNKKVFTLTFGNNKSFSASTDCNGVGGEYALNGNKITFNRMISTMMYCEGSQEADFSKMIGQIQSYHFTGKGELIFDLKLDSGVMVFR